MMNKILVPLFAILLLAMTPSCYKNHNPSETPTHCEFKPRQVKTQQQLSDYRVKIPLGWSANKKKVFNEETGLTRELIASGDQLLGKLPPVLTVISMPLNGASPEDFAGGVILALNQKEFKIISADVVKVDEQFATVVAYLSEDDLLVLQLNVASNTKGFIVACAGDPQYGHELIEVCVKILNTFHLNR